MQQENHQKIAQKKPALCRLPVGTRFILAHIRLGLVHIYLHMLFYYLGCQGTCALNALLPCPALEQNRYQLTNLTPDPATHTLRSRRS